MVGGIILMIVDHQAILRSSKHFLMLFSGNWLVAAISAYLLSFLGILVLRYVALIIYSYLEHLESISLDMPERGDGNDAVLPFITLVVPAYNEGMVIKQAISSLLQLDYPHYEIVVIDDGSTDDTYERALEIARFSDRIPVRVFTKPNGGKSDALNVGMAHAQGTFILNMDGDTKLSPNSLRACIRHFDDPNIGAVAGNVKVLNRENLITRIQALEYIEGLAMARKAQSFMRSVNIIPGPLGMFRKDALMEIGGYDHDTFAEDCDLTLKLLMQGWHIAYESTAIAWVETPSGILNLLKQRYRWTRGILQAIRKHRATLWHPIKHTLNFFILWYMLFESVLWPISNVLGNVFFAYIGFSHGVAIFLFYWWLQLTLLDIIAAAYCIIIEKEDVSLILYAPLFRIFYIVIIDVAKVIASIEEMRGTKMTWGKLQREGKL